jgi:predicted nucleic acid-binding protein
MPYLDANFLAKFYLAYDESAEVQTMVAGPDARALWPFPLTTLLRLELVNSIRRFAFESRRGGQWRVTPENCSIALARFEEDVAASDMFRVVDLTLENIADEFESLSARFTVGEGYRTYDLLHVASALRLECDTFWSYDRKALQLAKAIGLKTNR